MDVAPTVPAATRWPAAERDAMARALDAAATVRCATSPNPWVGCVVLAADGTVAGAGATAPPGGPHAEVVALREAGARAAGSTVVTTLEPCAHVGRTPPCTDALIEAGVARVVVGILDPDPQVAGRGVAVLAASGVDVAVGLGAEQVESQLAAYLKHRRVGRPWVVLKLAGTLDGRIAAPDGSSAWLTGPDARADAHRLRAESDAIVVGAGTVRCDDPQLTVRAPDGRATVQRQPLRVVLGEVPARARVRPALSLGGDLGDVLDELGRREILQVLVEGGARVAHAFHRAGLVDRYVVYLAPALFGGDDAVPMFAGPGAPRVDDLWRGRLVDVRRVGQDLRVELAPPGAGDRFGTGVPHADVLVGDCEAAPAEDLPDLDRSDHDLDPR
ncbi:MAG: bifunctional diaminohydroxyphosphoribosylaminopyrimidine deaminase/5-amino-6-(5-phosphoribosylamino)uracil reductase RibD [Actinomycetota bacterium]|jgi:diaminohydroxyphosphoribosylaminopyrimidine deaminase/5-amino-6-(5-phosphoribosylamino)uracil reductase|nr:bifunctional diaminohydroxyphosphoribosylaminopyrimidine deaminase/5-amino-6-(5-phosphoribosylamino)uracil reductase RibD [Actinomycetota bacterium]